MAAFGPFLDPTKVVLHLNYFIFLFSIKKLPKSHTFCSLFVFFTEGLVRRFIRDENGVHFDKPSPSYDQKDFVPVEVKSGSLVVIHGDLIHQRLVIEKFLHQMQFDFFFSF